MERVDLMINNMCNINCIFCYHLGIKDQDFDFSMEKIITALQAGRKKGYDEVYISGGEPTLNENLLDIIKTAKELGYKDIKIMTNGIRMYYNDYLKTLVNAGLNKVAFSLHGASDEVHDVHTGLKGSFKYIKKGMENAIKLSDRLTSEINTVVTKYNIDRLEEIAEMAHSIGIKLLHIQIVVPNSPNTKKLQPSRIAIEKRFREIIDKRGSRLNITFAFVPFCYMKGYEKYVCKMDFTEPFFSNCISMFESWKDSLLNSKRLGEDCHSCKHFRYCRGLWK